ncbi:MAG: hypothetical protein ABIJ56_16465 [Pseudomonadota bacterium]
MFSRLKKPIPVLLLVFIVIRLAILFTSDEIGNPEEARQGNLANEILDGREIYIEEFLYQDFEGSCILDALLVAVPYALTGGSGHSLKLVTLLISFLILVFSALIALELPRRRPAVIFIVLQTFAPTYFIAFHFHTIGGSLYGSLFNVIIFYAAIKIVRSPRPLLMVLWGFLCATGIYLNPACLPGILMSFVIVFIADKRLLVSRPMLYFLPSFALSGLICAMLMRFQIPVLGMIDMLFLSRDFRAAGLPASPNGESGLAGLFLHDLPHSFYFKGIDYYNAAYCALILGLFAAGCAAAAKGWKRMLALLAGKKPAEDAAHEIVPAAVSLMVVAHFLLFALSDISIPGSPFMVYYHLPYKFFYNVYPFLFLAAAFAIDALMEKYARLSRIIAMLCVIAVLPAAAATILLVRPGQLTLKSKFRSHDYKYFGRMIPASFRNDRIEGAVGVCMERDGPDRLDCIKGIAINHSLDGGSMQDKVNGVKTFCTQFPAKSRWLCVRGLGNRLMESFFLDAGSAIDLCGMLEPAYAGHCLHGYLEEVGHMIHREPEKQLALMTLRDASQKRLLLDNMGYWVYAMFQPNPEWSLRACGKLQEQLDVKRCANMVFYHLGMAEGSRSPDGPGGAFNAYEHLGAEYGPDFSRGLGFAAAWRVFPDMEKARAECRERGSAELAAACEKGVNSFYSMMEQNGP